MIITEVGRDVEVVEVSGVHSFTDYCSSTLLGLTREVGNNEGEVGGKITIVCSSQTNVLLLPLSNPSYSKGVEQGG